MKVFRLWDWWVYAVILIGAVVVLSPANVDVLPYKLALVALGGITGYLLDRSMFPYARPHQFIPPADARRHTPPTAALERQYPVMLAAACMLRRAIIVASAMVGVTMGL